MLHRRDDEHPILLTCKDCGRHQEIIITNQGVIMKTYEYSARRTQTIHRHQPPFVQLSDVHPNKTKNKRKDHNHTDNCNHGLVRILCCIISRNDIMNCY